MLQENKESISKKVEKYRKDVEELARFLPWLEGKQGEDLTKKVDPGEGKANTMQVPVYDSTLLGFIKKAQNTAFMDRNYMYAYRRLRIQSEKDELRCIDETQIMEIENIGSILSSYVLRGRTKGPVWNEGVRNGVYYHAVKRMKELIDFWTA
ncbi:MAG: hypothetical protein IK115_07200 [Lachnospiraceae bacterium]|nr:hypothetical protein [Lachnospiraceae bacterium]